MSRFETSFVLGYHGCDFDVAQQVLIGQLELSASDKSYDWLGSGVYFWESDPVRAKEWAEWKVARGDYNQAAVLGAVIDLGNCLDLKTRQDVEVVARAHESLVLLHKLAERPMPENRNVHGDKNEDRLLRYLDCAVFKHLHEMTAKAGPENIYDSVRGMFIEGEPAFPGSGFKNRTHTQIAVRNMACIKGYFLPRPL
jgi:hypothetical protein